MMLKMRPIAVAAAKCPDSDMGFCCIGRSIEEIVVTQEIYSDS